MTSGHARPTPKLTCAQVREIDRLAVEQLGIPSLILMENAGRNAAHVALEQLGRTRVSPAGTRVHILAGSGNNAGDGYVIARHLHNHGVHVAIAALKAPDELAGDAAVNAAICQRMKLALDVIHDPGDLPQLDAADLIIDALLGTGFRGEVKPLAAAAIERINAVNRGQTTVLAVDVPSGLDCTTGEPTNATVRADVTVTFAAYKAIFDNPAAGTYTGRVVVADIGTPPELLAAVRGSGPP
ncbi:MAG: NAD(P)H-hydrate epimerase [Phycisphaeraceae bacterium]